MKPYGTIPDRRCNEIIVLNDRRICFVGRMGQFRRYRRNNAYKMRNPKKGCK